MRILVLTTLYPNAAAPSHGVFVENRLKDFAGRTGADIKVVAPTPWFPFTANWAGRYANYARAPLVERRHGLEVRHPRYLIPPKVGMTYAPQALYRAFRDEARRLLDEGWNFDLIDAHYLYPDSVSAVRVAKELNKPIVITARGSDVTLFPRYPRQRTQILQATYQADAVVAVADALKDELEKLGAPSGKIRVLRNGVDLEMFRPLDRQTLRARMGLNGPVIASVGHLIERKGHHLVIEALTRLPDATLLIAGEGEMQSELEALGRRCGVSQRIRFLGRIEHSDLVEIYNAADALVLASAREGWPNVLLEAMACGTPVAATAVHGSKEAVSAPEAGLLIKERTPQAIASALKALLSDPPAREATRRHAEKHDWAHTSKGTSALFSEILAERQSGAATRHSLSLSPAAPRLLVTVDTEEIFDWSGFDGDRSVGPVDDIDRFQILCASFGVRPLYFLTESMLAAPAPRAYFQYLHARGAADFGIHLHAWATEPATCHKGAYYSYQCNLPQEAQRAKISSLCERFKAAFGAPPKAHRAGRYGADLRAYAALAENGVTFDFSPSPPFDFSFEGGPDFSRIEPSPFTVRAGGGEIFVIPVAGGRMVRGVRYALPKAFISGRPSAIMKHVTTPMRLSPEGAALEDMAALAKRLVAHRTPILTFSLHSSSLTAGGSPYAETSSDVDALLERSRGFFEFFSTRLNGSFVSLPQLENLCASSARGHA